MKKFLVLLLALTCVGAAFAQDAAETSGAEVTYGFSGSFGYNVLEDNVSDTYGADFETPVGTANPTGMTPTGFVVNPWIQMDWTSFTLKLDAKYDQTEATDDDYSYLDVDGTWNDILGTTGLSLNFSSVFSNEGDTDNNGASGSSDDSDSDGDVDGDDADMTNADGETQSGAERLAIRTSEVKLAYDGEEVDMYVLWDASAILGNFNAIATGAFIGDVAEGFKEANIAIDNDQLAASITYGLDGTEFVLSNAWINAKDLFGMWDIMVGDNDSTKYVRMQGLGLDTEVTGGDFTSDDSLGSFAANNFTAVEDANQTQFSDSDGLANDDSFSVSGIDVLNTITPVEGLTVYVGTIYPINEESGGVVSAWSGTFADYLADGFMDIGATFAIDGVGTVGAGMEVTMDYDAKPQPADVGGAYIAGPSNLIPSAVAGSANSLVNNAPGFWVDAKIDEMMDALNAQVSVGVDFQQYYDKLDRTTNAANLADAVDGYAIVAKNVTLLTLGVEASYAVMDALTVQAAIGFNMGMGADLDTWAGTEDTWTTADDAMNDDTDYVAANYTEANYLNINAYDVAPLTVAIRADYTLNDTMAFWFSNTFTALAGELEDSNADIATSRVIYGNYDKDEIELGATFTASEASSVEVKVGYNLYLGVPTAADAVIGTATTVQEDDFTAAYASWISDNYNPFCVSASYSFSY